MMDDRGLAAMHDTPAQSVPDPSSDAADPIVITIDGPAGTGKSTVAHGLARRLHLEYLDTGAMYRAATLAVLEAAVDPHDDTAVAEVVGAARIDFDWTVDPPRVLVRGRDVSDHIRSESVTRHVSTIAAHPGVRRRLVEAQRRIAAAHPRLVSEGRDQGSVVFPDAPLRFFLEADARVRARRRVEQLRAAGIDADPDMVEAELRRRDDLDAGRAVDPLVRPDGAVTVDTTDLTVDDVIDRLEQEVRERLPSRAFTT